MKKHFLAFCFFCFFVTQTTSSSSSSSVKDKKLAEFQAKIQNISPPSLPPAAPDTKRNGRVFYPVGYGADPTGVQECSDAFLQVLDEAFQVQKGQEMLPGVNDLGGLVIDLQGGNYKISKPIRFPSSGGGNIVVKGGTLRASTTFPSDRHLIELWSPNSQVKKSSINHQNPDLFTMKSQSFGNYYEDITFHDILFDSSYQGGGIFIVDSVRIRINNCFFLHFSSQGISVQKGHEIYISNCFLGQHPSVGGDKIEKDYSGTAIVLASNDNAITDVAIFSAAIGVLLTGQANILTGVHCYNKATGFGGVGVLIKQSGAQLTRVDNCYFDYTAIVIEDPVQVHVTNGLFLGDANVVLKSIKGRISGLNIVDNMFNGSPSKNVPIVKLDGGFSSIDQVVIDRNNVNGMKLKSTVGKMSVTGNGAKWVADFSSILLFPNKICHFQYSFYMGGVASGFVTHAVTNISSNVVVVESDKAVNGVVAVAVDQNNMVRESIFF
ncbi:hypothetical protein Patl1_12231 [Pistacia atlantica]|uniref:Uncharacterized protein n=1 Tax=Pistacia atlantica TaxID=434234 RepID=A0ACC1A6Z4_9ROSI|nr:hypothetical protein Patl1_12231 [Pistacia atlantica]